jgi:hypothetical protein
MCGPDWRINMAGIILNNYKIWAIFIRKSSQYFVFLCSFSFPYQIVLKTKNATFQSWKSKAGVYCVWVMFSYFSNNLHHHLEITSVTFTALKTTSLLQVWGTELYKNVAVLKKIWLTCSILFHVEQSTKPDWLKHEDNKT